MKKRTLIFGITAVMLGMSCREQDLVETKNATEVAISEASVVKGRLYFPNKESLQYAYNSVKNEDDEVIAKYIDSKNIISLRPVITEENEKLVAEKLGLRVKQLKNNKRLMKSNSVVAQTIASDNFNNDDISEHIDDLEEIIGDDAYAAFLNSDAEIQVADKIYKYTDVGLFVVKVDKYDELKTYLQDNNISDNLLYSTNKNVANSFIQRHPEGILTALSHNIEYFRSDISNDDNKVVSPKYSTLRNNQNNLSVFNNQDLSGFINQLQNCSPHNGVFDGIFGDSDICVDRYEKRRRVKTKAYNYDYLLVYNLGVKVKHQYRGWTGLWRKEKCEEIRMGVISSMFYYDYSGYFNPAPNTNRVITIYNTNTRIKFNPVASWEQRYDISSYNMDAFPKIFKDDIYIEDILRWSSNISAIDAGIHSAMKAGNRNLTSQYLNEKFWKETFKFLENIWKDLGRTPTNNNITYSLNATDLGKLVVFKTMYRNSLNDDKIEKSFDWGFQAGFNIGSDGHIQPDLSGGKLNKPKEFRVTMYGIAKRGGKWHGSKINTIN